MEKEIILSFAIAKLIQALGYHAENMTRAALGQLMAYGDEQFLLLVEEIQNKIDAHCGE